MAQGWQLKRTFVEDGELHNIYHFVCDEGCDDYVALEDDGPDKCEETAVCEVMPVSPPDEAVEDFITETAVLLHFLTDRLDEFAKKVGYW